MRHGRARGLALPVGVAAALFLGLAIAPVRSRLSPTPPPRLEGNAVSTPDPERLEQQRWARGVLAAAKSAAGQDSLEAADAMDRLAIVLGASARPEDLAEARELAQRCISIREAMLPAGDPQIASGLADLVDILWRFGRFEEARQPAERALALRRRLAGPGDPGLATSLYQLASLLRIDGDYARSAPLYREAIATWRAAPGDRRQDIASALHYLGVLSWSLGDTAEARRLIDRSLGMLEEALGPDHPLVAQRLHMLGGLAVAMGQRGRARDMYEEARRIWTRSLGPDHPDVARALTSLGRLRLDAGDTRAARQLFERALAIRTGAFGHADPLVANSLADLGRVAQAEGDLAAAHRQLLQAVTLLGPNQASPDSELVPALVALARVEVARGDVAAALSHAIRAERQAREVFRRSARGLPDPDALRYAARRVGGLDAAIAALLGERTPSPPEVVSVFDEVIRSRGLVLDVVSRFSRQEDPAGVEQVRRALPPDTALVAYVRYDDAPRAGRLPEKSYAAFVLDREQAGPMIQPLGPSRRIDAAVQAWRAEAGADPRLRATGTAEREYRAAGNRVRSAVWDPVAAEVAGHERVFVVPDGTLGLVSLAALPSGDGRYLLETAPRIHYLSAERDLLDVVVPHPEGEGALVMGGVAFGGPAAPGVPGFERLPGTGREAAEVASLVAPGSEVAVMTGRDATEAAFRRLAPGRRLLHLATHGYFLERELPGRDPFQLSGLAMAGANRRQEAATSLDDGVMTAREIAALDLSSVDWVVLSGCDTGLGVVMDGEGVLGVRRAFRIAGAHTLIMSLWAVDDGAARAWMRRLYEARARGLSTDRAVEAAGLALLRAQRNRGATVHPYFWGGFVAAGDWR